MLAAMRDPRTLRQGVVGLGWIAMPAALLHAQVMLWPRASPRARLIGASADSGGAAARGSPGDNDWKVNTIR